MNGSAIPAANIAAPIGGQLYLPESWTKDRARCARAGVPEEISFATKPMIALQLVREALADGVAPAPVLGDEAKLRQVVSNLVGNALRYTPKGSPIEIGVGVRTTPEGSRQSVIEVRDHGPGVPDDEAARIFERFYRADTSRTRETGGSGLGLAIVAAIVGSHSGSVRMIPTDGGGATMVVSLPFRDEAAVYPGIKNDGGEAGEVVHI